MEFVCDSKEKSNNEILFHKNHAILVMQMLCWSFIIFLHW